VTTRKEGFADLASAILDGAPIDWASAQSGADEAERRVVVQLRRLATIADFHRDFLGPSSSPAALTATDSLAEKPGRWGHLEVLERIGRGAFGEVYRAWDTRLDREVALKLLPAASALAHERATSIIEEGRLLARVRHPNVVTIYGAERLEDRIGLWMEFVEGRTLAQAVDQDGVFTPARAVDIGIELCHAVSAVHQAGLLHRDIKAHNVMLADDGRLLLMDFGTGRELGDGATALAGTPLYLAPEVLAGAEASVASDIYSVGVLLYHLLTGSYPVSATGVRDLRLAHQHGERADLKALRPEVPAKLARIVERAIDPRPEQRHGSADALASSLAALKPRARASRVAYALAFAVVTALVVWAGFQLRGREGGRASSESAVAATTAIGGTPGARGFDPAQRPVIAVLPLKNLSAEPDSDYFADGLTDELIRNLAVIDGLDVRSRTSSFFFKDKPRNLRDVAEQLRVNLVVEGSVLLLGKRLRINAQLVRVAGDVPLWSERFDRELKDIFAIQDEISRAIVNHLRLTLGRGQRRYDTNLQAYELYLKARALLDRRDDVDKAVELFRQVIAEDPAFAPAYAGLANAYPFLTMTAYAGGVYLERAQSVMRPAAAKALQLDPLLAEAHAAMGAVYSFDRDWTNGEKSFRRAIELNPGISLIPTTYSMWTLRPLGRLNEAEQVLRAAMQSDPLSLDVRRELARVYVQAHRYEQALAEIEHLQSIDPDFPNVDDDRGRALMFAGRLPEAIRVLEGPPGGWSDAALAHAYVRSGRRADAEKLALAERGYPIPQAGVYAALGDKDRALHALNRALIREPHRVAWVLAYPEMAGLRGDPRFAALRERLNLPPDVPDRAP
jgi:TolB-like protein